MTPVFCCGLECGVIGAGAEHFNSDTGFSVSTTTFRSGLRSLRSNQAATAGTSLTIGVVSSINKVWRVYIRFATLPNVDCIIGWCDYGGSSAGIGYKTSDTKLYSAVEIAGVNTFGSTGVTVTTGVWYRIDVKSVGSVVTGTCDIQVDGTACGQATGAFVVDAATNVNFGSNGVNITADIFYDDLVVSNTLGDYPIGAGFVNHFIPTADGTHNIAGTADFRRTLTATDILNSTTDAFELVNDVPLESGASVDWINMLLPVNATDYVECIFGPAPGISSPTAGPRAVEVIAGIHQAGTGAGNMEIRMNDNGTLNTMYTASGVAGVTSVAYKRKHYATAIAGGGAWVIGGGGNGDFTDLRVRFGSPAALDVNPDQYFDCIMIEAEFLQVAVIPNKIIQVKQAVKRANYY